MRFSDEDMNRAMERTRLPLVAVAEIITSFDRGFGDIDDIIDEWENDKGF